MKISYQILFVLLTLIGCDGPEGKIGPSGLKSLIKTTTVQSGIDCPSGGIKIDVGIDKNENDILDSDEIDDSLILCNGPENYLTHVALVNQAGTNAPQSTIIKNTLDINIVWARSLQGKFTGTLSKNVDLNKTVILNNNVQVICKFISSSVITLENSCGVNAFCDDFSNLTLEIKSFN